jgi:hypothetical protein
MSTTWAGLTAASSYRTYRLDWIAEPVTSPIVVAKAGSAYFSWNGATDVASWKVYEGETASLLKLTKTVRKTGFETKVCISNSTKFVQVSALWKLGYGRLGSSNVRNSSVVAVS